MNKITAIQILIAIEREEKDRERCKKQGTNSRHDWILYELIKGYERTQTKELNIIGETDR